MASSPSYEFKRFRTQKARGLRDQLIALVLAQFPRFGGERIAALCVDMILEVLDSCAVPAETLFHGQVLFSCYPADYKPGRHDTIERVQLARVILDLHTPEELDELAAGTARSPEAKGRRLARLCEQAFAQGGLLSNSDLQVLTGAGNAQVASLLTARQEKTGKIVPRRATLQDVGTGVSHKAIICRMRHLEGKEPHLIARDTCHSLEAVDAYLGQFERVRMCRDKGMTPQETAAALGRSARLVQECLELERDIETERKRRPQGPAAP